MRRVGSSLLLVFAVSLLPTAALAQGRAFITNQSYNYVNVFRTSDWFPLGSIPVGQAPTGISIPASGGFAYVANRGSNNVSRIDLATATVTATIPVPGNPTQVAVNSAGTKAYVVQPNNCPTPTPTPIGTPTPTPDPLAPTPTPTPPPPCTVAVIDTATNTVTGNVTVGHAPFAVAFAPSDGFAYVTNRTDGTISVIDASTDQVIDELPVGTTPEGAAVGSGEVYVANDVSNTVTVYREIDLQPLATIPVGAGPLGLAIAPDGLTAMVSNDVAGTVSIIETATQSVRQTVATGAHPAGIGYLPDSSQAVVANNTGNTISVVNVLDGSVMNLTLTGSPSGVAIEPEPVFTLTKLGTPYQVVTGGLVLFELGFKNNGSGHAYNVTITDPLPHPDFAFVSATDGGALVGSDIVWTLPTLERGAVGIVSATLSVGATIQDGTLVTNVATIADPSGHSASGEAPVRVRIPGSLDLSATYRKASPGSRPRDGVRAKTRFALPPGFDTTRQVDITFSTPTQVLFQFTIPAGQLQERRGRFRYNGYTTAGVKIRLVMSPDDSNPGQSRVRFHATKATLPMADSPQIRLTMALGADVFSTERVFEVKRAPPGGQKLVYQD